MKDNVECESTEKGCGRWFILNFDYIVYAILTVALVAIFVYFMVLTP